MFSGFSVLAVGSFPHFNVRMSMFILASVDLPGCWKFSALLQPFDVSETKSPSPSKRFCFGLGLNNTFGADTTTKNISKQTGSVTSNLTKNVTNHLTDKLSNNVVAQHRIL